MHAPFMASLAKPQKKKKKKNEHEDGDILLPLGDLFKAQILVHDPLRGSLYHYYGMI